jgi:hypothetical protein
MIDVKKWPEVRKEFFVWLYQGAIHLAWCSCARFQHLVRFIGTRSGPHVVGGKHGA